MRMVLQGVIRYAGLVHSWLALGHLLVVPLGPGRLRLGAKVRV
jgi:hypothetical protein